MTSGASVIAPSITALTTMVAETVAKANPSTAEIDAAKTTVAGVTGVATTDLYKNPMTNGDVFKAATLVNELVASGMKADPTQTPADLIKAMAANTTAKLTDATLDPAKLMGLSAANAAIMQAQMSTMQAKADAMKSVADAVAANVASADQAALTPADAGQSLDRSARRRARQRRSDHDRQSENGAGHDEADGRAKWTSCGRTPPSPQPIFRPRWRRWSRVWKRYAVEQDAGITGFDHGGGRRCNKDRRLR